MSNNLIDAPVLSYPDMSWEQAMVLLYHFEEGRKVRDRFVAWREMIDAMHKRHGFAAFGAGTYLRDVCNPPLLIFEKGKPLTDRHRIPELCFRDVDGFFAAINAAEAKAKKPLTPKPDESEPGTHHTAEHVYGLKIGAIVSTPSGPAQIVADADGLPQIRLLTIIKDADAKPKAPEPAADDEVEDDEEDSRPAKATKPVRGGKGRKGSKATAARGSPKPKMHEVK